MTRGSSKEMDQKAFQARLNESLTRYAENTAIEYGDRTMTYSQLDRRTSGIAHWLAQKKIKPATFIGILIEDRMEFICTMMGILKARCVFVPLDPAYPKDRLALMMETTNLEYVITDQPQQTLFTPGETRGRPMEFIPIERVFTSPDLPGERQAAPAYKGTDKIYIYFTSGTTGTPRAVLGKNNSLLHFIEWEIETFRINETFRFSQFTNLGFDALLRDVFVPLCSGGTVCIPGDKEITTNPVKLTRWLDQVGVQVIHCVPAFFRMLSSAPLSNDNFKALKFVLLSGEKIYPSDLRAWYDIFADRVQLVNFYGPTETTMIKTFYFMGKSDTEKEWIPIGKPMKGARVIIMDEGMKICKPKMVGQLYIRTPYRTFGYYNDPQLNRERFIQNPYNKDDPEDLLYATGDMGRLLPDGNIELLGRKDRQVKIRGVRVEPEEIENLLASHPQVKEAVVIKEVISRTNEQLCGFVTLTGQDLLAQSFIDYLAERVPAYMVPARVIKMEKIPRNPNGKVDYDQLERYLETEKQRYISPRNDVEKTLEKMWTQILAVPQVGVRSPFFEMGGNSLNLMRLIEWIHKEFDIRISLGEIFNNPTIEKQAIIIMGAKQDKYTVIEAVEKKEYYPLSPAQQRLYVLQQLEPESTAYNIPYTVLLEGEPDKMRLAGAFKKLLHRHESLRTSFALEKANHVQRIHDTVEFNIEYDDSEEVEESIEEGRVEAEKNYKLQNTNYKQIGALREDVDAFGENSLIAKSQELRAKSYISSFIRPFDLSQAPLLRVGLMKLPHTPTVLRGHPSPEGREHKYLLVVDMHHIVSDGISQDLLTRDFSALYQDEADRLPGLRIQYKDYSEWRNGAGGRERGRKTIMQQESYWLNEFAGETPLFNLPTDYKRPAVHSLEGDSLNFTIDENLTGQLKQLARETETTLFMVLLTAFYVVLSKYSRQEDIVIGSPIFGRTHSDLENIIGMFVNMLALRNYPQGNKSFKEFLQEVRHRTLKAFENQDYQFEDLVRKLGLHGDFTRNPLFDVVFLLHNMAVQPVESEHNADRESVPGEQAQGEVKISPYPFKHNISRFDLLLGAMEIDDIIAVELRYATALFKPATVERIWQHYLEVLEQVTANNDMQLQEVVISHHLVAAAANLNPQKQVVFDF